jgi:hypothetical protein
LVRRKIRWGVLFVSVVAVLAVAVIPVAIAVGQEVNPVRVLPDTVQKGEIVDVTVNFTAPADNFSPVGLTDLAPDGWNVTVDKTWCTPNAEFVNATENKAEIMWYGQPGVGFDKDTSFTALYKVTVPDDAELGIYAFDGSVEYYVGPEGPYSKNITGGSQVEVVEAGGIGVWWIVTIVVVVAIIVVAVLVVRRRGT